MNNQVSEERSEILYYAFNYDFEIAMTMEQAESASHAGRCDEDVAYLLSLPEIAGQLNKIDPDRIRNELREYGAWDDDELANDEDNRARIVWIAAGNIAEGEGY